jgi:hypothetical protein
MPDFIQIALVNIDADNSFRDGRVDLLQAVSTRDAQHSNASRAAVAEGGLEDIRDSPHLLYSFGAHVPFVMGERK